MLMKIAGRVRGLFAGNYPENREDEQFHVNTRGDQMVSQGLPPYTEIVRMGNSWMAKTTTAFAALTTEPTTVAALTLYNGNPDNGPTIIIDSVFLWERVADATQENYTALFHMLNSTADAAPSAGTVLASSTLKSLSGRVTYPGKIILRAGGTVVDNGWSPLGNSEPFAAAIAGAIWKTKDVKVEGLYQVPPKSAYSVNVAKVAATASQLQIGIRFHEVQQIVVP